MASRQKTSYIVGQVNTHAHGQHTRSTRSTRSTHTHTLQLYNCTTVQLYNCTVDTAERSSTVDSHVKVSLRNPVQRSGIRAPLPVSLPLRLHQPRQVQQVADAGLPTISSTVPSPRASGRSTTRRVSAPIASRRKKSARSASDVSCAVSRRATVRSVS